MCQTKGIFELRITNADKKEAVWTIDLKNKGVILKGLASPKADVTLIMSDDTFSQLASGKVRSFERFNLHTFPDVSCDINSWTVRKLSSRAS